MKGVTTETGAGQWGTALSMACSYLDLDCKVYMVKCSYEQKPFRREVMRTYGASVLLHRLKQQKWEEKFWQSIRELQEALDVPFPRLWKWLHIRRDTAMCLEVC